MNQGTEISGFEGSGGYTGTPTIPDDKKKNESVDKKEKRTERKI